MSSADATPKLEKNEYLKEESNNLRGTLMEELADSSTAGITADASQLTKFHGMYVQDDRDIRGERRVKKLEKAYSFMLRVRLPGGVCTPEQYLMMDQLSSDYGNHTIRLTTRQTYQLHGLLKGNLRNVIRGMDKVLMDSIGACGDINRNVMCQPDFQKTHAHAKVYEVAKNVSLHLLPKGKAYREIFIDGEKFSGEVEEEPVYGKTYLPRKFKIGVAIPPTNDVDVFSQDLGFIAIFEGEKLLGFNVSVGGGLGTTHGNDKTYPRVGDVMGFCTTEQVNQVAEAVVLAQRDNGSRTDRKNARLKYTIARMGLAAFKAEVEKRTGFALGEAKPFQFTTIQDDYGWNQDIHGDWYYVQFVASGRIVDKDGVNLRTAFREIAKIHNGDIRLTPTQNLAFCGIKDSEKAAIQKILDDNGVAGPAKLSGLRKNAMACPALPTCGLALSESERFIPELLDQFETVLDEAGLRDDAISIRMTGCPNGCARPYLAEIGLIGKAPGKYNLYLGAAYNGMRLNTLYKESITSEEIVPIMEPHLKSYAKDRQDGEGFGDYCVRTGIVTPPSKNTVGQD
ncbi:Nitrite and sulphite reductase 4Fe-4S domain protein [Verrucomicrobiia bacterium DG1235]|nr:Nitrite and sulphite reductase 4Fe-4S domain protein [Verrucomicrobiae bacterium DG1235]